MYRAGRAKRRAKAGLLPIYREDRDQGPIFSYIQEGQGREPGFSLYTGRAEPRDEREADFSLHIGRAQARVRLFPIQRKGRAKRRARGGLLPIYSAGMGESPVFSLHTARAGP